MSTYDAIRISHPPVTAKAQRALRHNSQEHLKQAYPESCFSFDLPQDSPENEAWKLLHAAWLDKDGKADLDDLCEIYKSAGWFIAVYRSACMGEPAWGEGKEARQERRKGEKARRKWDDAYRAAPADESHVPMDAYIEARKAIITGRD